jgi:uncharacterized lipoprotein YmbA
MNNIFETGTSIPRNPKPFQVRADAVAPRFGAVLFALALGAGLAGCSFLKPAQSTARYFVLSPAAATLSAPAASNALAVGLGQVKLPAYLFETSFAVRKATNEIEYLPSALWAERMDTGFQRVLAANLATLLPSDHIHLSAWQKDAVAAEVYVILHQFDVDSTGQGVLVAQWRILSPGGEKTLKLGTSRLSRQGPSPDAGASGPVATLSQLVTDFSRQLAQALQEATSGQRAPVSK